MNFKNSLLATLLTISFLSLSAQVTIGLHGSYGESWQEYSTRFNPTDGPAKIESFQVKVSVYHSASKIISIGLEPGYSRRGAFCESCFEGGGIFIDPDGTMNIGLPYQVEKAFYANYIELPLMIKGELSVFGSLFRVSGKVGIGPSYITKGYTIRSNYSPIVKDHIDFNSENNRLHRWDIGAYSGLAVGYPVGPGLIQVEGNYYHGLLNSNNTFNSAPRTLNRSLRFGIGYTISL